ncbi:ubiquinone biosynthesis monooxygenase COQ6 [Elsinoe australis]|uniref:Ubiquinone biosynthesis monooxygenase COQ6 n=1 Tax=Elsinoe australis TaxID=40998 RepID=A0A2P8A4Q7_9PEZI|nr:ubiquinone biosynthesis monooxygenase COQ6 [Elsinoe australis]
MSHPHVPIIIIGAGPVGLITALNIARLQVPVLILERGPGIDQSPRATSYQPCAMAELEECGVLSDVRAKSVINNILSYWIGRGPEKEQVAYVEKMEGGDRFPSGINCPQPVLTETVAGHLRERYRGLAETRFCQEVKEVRQAEEKVEVACLDVGKGEELRYSCDWLVGADGASSAVRRLLGIEFEGFSWPKEDFCASNVRYPFEKYGFTTANFILDPVHWAVITVIDNTGLWRCAFGVRPGMTNEQIREELDEHYKHIFPGWPGEGYKLVQWNKYKPHQRCASQFRKGQCLLVGDAAHSNNPIGGLGLTTGLLDAGPLGRALGAVVNGRAPASILDTWAEARREKWISFTNGFSISNKRMVQRGGYSDDPAGIWKIDEVSRQHGMDQWLEQATPDKKEEDLAMYEALKDKQAQMQNRMKQWEICMDPRWMAEYEDPEVVQARLSLRPKAVS